MILGDFFFYTGDLKVSFGGKLCLIIVRHWSKCNQLVKIESSLL